MLGVETRKPKNEELRNKLSIRRRRRRKDEDARGWKRGKPKLQKDYSMDLEDEEDNGIFALYAEYTDDVLKK